MLQLVNIKKNYLMKDFCKNEYKKRSLPLYYSYFEHLTELLSLDFTSFLSINNMFYNFDTQQLEETEQVLITSGELISYLSVINLITNTNPELFIEDNKMAELYDNIKYIIDKVSIDKYQLKYAKKTLSNLKRLEKQFSKVKRLEY